MNAQVTELCLFQFRDHDLLQLTDGRAPHSTEENRKGWHLLKKIAATAEGIAEISTRPSREVLREIGTQGYCEIATWRQIQPRWHRAHTAEGRARND